MIKRFGIIIGLLIFMFIVIHLIGGNFSLGNNTFGTGIRK
jgi:hypothetical protein